MVYWNDGYVWFPKTYVYSGDDLILTHQVTKNVYTYSVDEEDYESLGVDFSGSDGELEDGQYTYSIGLETGIFQKGDFVKDNKTEYETEIKYKQYEL